MNLKQEELVKALRCTATPGGPTGDCEMCPYYRRENLNDELKEKLGTDTWTSCDIDKVGMDAADQIERDQKEIEALREKQQWIPVAERLPEELVLVNVVWVNRVPEPYYEKIKGVPFSGTACFFEERWYWDSPIVLDLLSEYGKDDPDLVDDAVDITHWMPLPEPPKEDNHDA